MSLQNVDGSDCIMFSKFVSITEINIYFWSFKISISLEPRHRTNMTIEAQSTENTHLTN